MARKYVPPPAPIAAKFTIEEIDRHIPKIQRVLDKVKKLRDENVPYNDQRVENIESDIQNVILVVFGPHSPEYRDYQHHTIWDGSQWVGMTPLDCQQNYQAGIPKTITLLEGLIERLEEHRLDLKHSPSSTSGVESPPQEKNSNVFIVHGRNGEVKATVARFIQLLGLNPIILHEQPSQGRTLIEKFEHHSNVGYAIILLTADDKGCLKEDADNSASWNDRPRQNVVFEFGYFAGKLSRKKVCAIFERGIEIPSDLDGLVYIPWDGGDSWKFDLVRELRAAGFNVDANRAFQ